MSNEKRELTIGERYAVETADAGRVVGTLVRIGDRPAEVHPDCPTRWAYLALLDGQEMCVFSSDLEPVPAQETDNATPRPWRVRAGRRVHGQQRYDVYGEGFVAADCTEHDAALIVRAVNSFDALREACEMAAKDAISRQYLLPADADETTKRILQAQIDTYAAALALAGKVKL